MAFLFLVLFEREKIWAGSYIEFPLLLKQARDLHMDAHNTGELVIKHGKLVVARQQLNAITNIHTWTTAFIVYMSIYLEKFPGEAHEMLTYMHKIRLAASRVGQNGWSKYDSNVVLRRSATLLCPLGQYIMNCG